MSSQPPTIITHMFSMGGLGRPGPIFATPLQRPLSTYREGRVLRNTAGSLTAVPSGRTVGDELRVGDGQPGGADPAVGKTEISQSQTEISQSKPDISQSDGPAVGRQSRRTPRNARGGAGVSKRGLRLPSIQLTPRLFTPALQ